MRLEATVPDSRGSAIVELAAELGLSRSQLVDEALALFLKVVMEVRQGRRVVTLSPESSEPGCELVTPTIAGLQWALNAEKLELPPEVLARMHALAEAPPQPSARLRAAAARHGK